MQGKGQQFQYTPPKDQRFSPISGPRDLIWAILFVAHLIAVLGLCIYGVVYTSNNTTQTGGLIDARYINKVYLITAGCAGFAILLAVLWIFLLRRVAHYVVWFTLLFSVVMLFVAGILGFVYLKSAYFLIVFGLVGLINLLFIYLWRKRIPFATALLTVVSEVTNIYPATIIISFISLLVQALWIIIWVLTFVGAQQLFASNGNMGNVLIFILLVSFYWTAQVIGNTVHVTCAGTFATWYFLGGTSSMQENPTLKSFKRATTTSFGSVCLGSLLIAIIQALRNMVRNSRNSRSFMAIILACLLACIENLIHFFNKYAFTQVAIYGKTFCQAAKDTFNLLKERGVDAIVNNVLTGKVMGMMIFISAIICGLCGGIWGYYDNDLKDTYLFILTGIFGFLIGMVLVGQVLFVIDSGITTIFVCFAEEPQALNSTKPALYQLFRETYEEGSPLLFQA